MLETLFGNSVIEKILFYLLVNRKCYASELRNTFKTSLYSFQNALKRLEKGNIIASHHEGKTLIFQFNPRYPFLVELETFLKRAYSFLPEDMKKKYYEKPIRKRPRRSGKPL